MVVSHCTDCSLVKGSYRPVNQQRGVTSGRLTVGIHGSRIMGLGTQSSGAV